MASHADPASLEPFWLTRDEAAARARVSRVMVDRAIRRGELRAGGGPKSTRIRPEWVDEWVERGKGTSAGAVEVVDV